jgi:hypothetical protein
LTFMISCQNEGNNLDRDLNIPWKIEPEKGQQSASGIVFHDKNQNRKKDENEPGIRGIAVSNGVEVVVTNDKGKYALPVGDDNILFVIKPKNWMTPVDENFIPQFYYLHKPSGSPDHLEYAGVKPTGQLPESIDFPLYPSTYKTDYQMVVFGDPQPYNIEEVDYYSEEIIGELLGRTDLEFGITMGDIVGDDLDLFEPLNQATAKIGSPWDYVLGNHDINFDVKSDELSDETFERVYGPPNYAFVYGEVHFIVVDDVLYHSDGKESGYIGGLRKDQLSFVENYLKTVPKNKLIVLNMHIPLAQHDDTFRKKDQQQLFDLLKEFPHTLSISAHTHTQNNTYFHSDSSDWQQPVPHHHYNVGTTSGSWWRGLKGETDIPHTMMRDGTPNGYSIIHFKGTQYIIDWKVAGSPEDYQMNIHTPRGIEKGSMDTVPLIVNFFNGGEQTEVFYRVSGLTDWKKMRREPRYDPYFEKLYQRWRYFKNHGTFDDWTSDTLVRKEPLPGKPLPYIQKSTHIWMENIGSDWPVGSHVIEVKVEDRYGRIFLSRHLIRIYDIATEQ